MIRYLSVLLLGMSAAAALAQPAASARVSVTNKGARAGADTVQLYLVDGTRRDPRNRALRRAEAAGRYGSALGDTAAQLGPVVTVELGADQPK